MELIGENRAFGGRHLRYTHKAETTQCDMTFAIFKSNAIALFKFCRSSSLIDTKLPDKAIFSRAYLMFLAIN